jgi:hypothetical protein
MNIFPELNLSLFHKMTRGADQDSVRGIVHFMLKTSRFVQLITVLALCVTATINPIRTSLAQDATPTTSTLPLTITVSGTVTNGTAGVTAPIDTPLLLQVAHPDPATGKVTEAAKKEAKLGADSRVQFEPVIAYSGDIVFVSAVFKGIQQVSAPIQIANGQSTLDVPLTLYDVTNDPAVVALLRVQHILDFQQGLMRVLATYDFRNSSDKLYVSKDRTTSGLPVSVTVPLPVGAQAVAFSTQNGERFAVGGSVNSPVVQDTKPLTPGQVQQVVFSYQLPYASGTPIDQDYPFGANLLEVLIPSDANVVLGGVRVNGTLLDMALVSQTADTTINPKRRYVKYAFTTPFKPSDRLIYTLSKGQSLAATAPIKTAQSSGPTLIEMLLVGFLILAGLGAIVFFVRRSTSTAKPAKK